MENDKILKIFNEEETAQKEIESFRKRKATRIILQDKDKNIALIYSHKHNYYQIPGGGVEENETINEGLKRETKEETGCEITNVKELGVTHEVRSTMKKLNISYGFFAEVFEEKQNPDFAEDEIQDGFEIMWVTKEKAKELLTSNVYDQNSKYLLYEIYTQKRDLLFLEKAERYIK